MKDAPEGSLFLQETGWQLGQAFSSGLVK